eukprot:10973872-Alexandrium_andersonii.AAC.1
MGTDERAQEYVFPNEVAYNWLRPVLLVGEVNYSRDVRRTFQARLCPYDNCRYQHACAVCGADGRGAWICGARRQRVRQQGVDRCYVPRHGW